MVATTLPWQPLNPIKLEALPTHHRRSISVPHVVAVRAFRRSDIDGFAKRMASGEAWRDAWRSANDGFDRLLFEAKKTAERMDRRYSVKQRLSSIASSAAYRAREIDREFEIGVRWRTFSMDFSRNWPRYRVQLNNILDTPLGRSMATIFFLWFALSGWLFRFLLIAMWVLPFACTSSDWDICQ
ncbi:Replicase polyprotein 1ab protein [Quillaja saponaria]|uniref:Replicase polyprotein 1ab protein n=1 Tax=Quillaja saponaria TaxID=32244 RepID=A0AAD7VP02_QUISA|nr:Replicase polyprotein 1ab protein [Quillaja saponaria]